MVQCNLLLIRVQPTANPNWAFPVQPTANPSATYCLLLLLLLLLLLAQVTYNQVRPLRINYLASSHRVKLI